MHTMSTKSRNGSSSPWASDESTENLLGSILEDTLDAAQQEARQLDDAILESTRHQEEERRARKLERQQANARAIAREEDRQREVQKRRTAALEAIRATDHPIEPQEMASHESSATPPARRAEPVAIPSSMLHPLEPVPAASTAAASPMVKGRPRHAMFATLAAVTLAVVAAASLLAAITLTGYHMDQTSYPKTLMQPRSAKDPLTTASYQPIPRPAAILTEPESLSSSAAAPRSTHQRKRPTVAAQPAVKSKPEGNQDRLKDIFKGDDTNIFGTVDKFGSDL